MTSVGTGLRYRPDATYEVTYRDVEYLRDGATSLLARVYQPQGQEGPFPAIVAVHGGAWAGKEWLQNEGPHMALAASGLVIAGIQMRTSADGPHPIAQRDISYAIRWLKAHAGEFNASPFQMGAAGWSSGGHQVMLGAMRQGQYAGIPLAEAPEVDDSVAYIIMGWPVIDPLARYKMMEERGAQDFLTRHIAYFGDEAGMIEASPPHILERGESVRLPPTLLVQGAEDQALPPMMAERFAEQYSRAGGEIELAKYPGEPHGFMRLPGPSADKAIAFTKSFIARHLL